MCGARLKTSHLRRPQNTRIDRCLDGDYVYLLLARFRFVFTSGINQMQTTVMGWSVQRGATVLGMLLLVGCQADYSADIRNRTSTPVFAQLFVKPHGADGQSILGASKRLGPGDRAFIGPVRASDNPGAVFVSVDSLPNAARPASLDLLPGTSFLDVTDESGVLRLSPKP